MNDCKFSGGKLAVKEEGVMVQAWGFIFMSIAGACEGKRGAVSVADFEGWREYVFDGEG